MSVYTANGGSFKERPQPWLLSIADSATGSTGLGMQAQVSFEGSAAARGRTRHMEPRKVARHRKVIMPIILIHAPRHRTTLLPKAFSDQSGIGSPAGNTRALPAGDLQLHLPLT